jgi:hypothetical protein
LQRRKVEKEQEVEEILGQLRRFKSTFFLEMENLGER